MPTLNELARRPSVVRQEFVDAIETMASNGKDLGLLEASAVIAIMDRCDPPLVRRDLEMLMGYCRRACTDLQNSGRGYAAQDWSKILEAVEARLVRMPR